LNTAGAVVSGLSWQARELLAGKFAADSLTWLAFELTVFLIARAAYAGTPFQVGLVKALRWDAVIVLVLQTLSQYLEGMLQGQIGQELFAVNANDLSLPQAGQSFNFPMWQLGVALLLLVVANIFDKGSQLTRDTDGLV